MRTEQTRFNKVNSAAIFALQDYFPQPTPTPSAVKLQAPDPQALVHPAADPLVPTIFHESWWLDIVTGGDYEVAEVIDKGAVVGRLPYFLRSRMSISYSLMPPMTHFLGPAIAEGDGNPPTRFLRRSFITSELIKQLPPASVYQYKCHRDITDSIAFQQEKFMTSVQFTHEIAPAPEEVLWANLRGQKRKKIRQAQQQLTVGTLDDITEFWHFYHRNLEKRGVENRCDREVCTRLIEACLTRDRGRIHVARDKNNAIVAAIFCIWDRTSSYYYMSTRRRDAHHGAISLLAWEAMKDASKRGLIFDFDGLSNANGVLFFTEFGGVVSPRYVVTRKSAIGRVAMAIRENKRESRFFY